ncbi:MAG: lysophospholipase L1-like esterase [Planctomycetota bacterium]|jgi:lysophospholipase L1-like esterase
MHDPSTNLPRRQLLQTTAAALGGLGLGGCASPGGAQAQAKMDGGCLIRSGDVVLFQGDSITDAGRSREHAQEANGQPGLGHGYAWLAASGLLVNPALADLQVFNRGISGHKVFQLADRWDADCLAIEPDVLSILIGVNDIWHARNGNYDGTVEVYERDLDALLERTRKALPETKLVICEPFVLRCGAIDDSWFPEFDTYRAAARRVAQKHATVWVAFQSMFDEAIKYAPPEHWAGDGVHPSAAGASLMAQAWLRAVGA